MEILRETPFDLPEMKTIVSDAAHFKDFPGG